MGAVLVEALRRAANRCRGSAAPSDDTVGWSTEPTSEIVRPNHVHTAGIERCAETGTQSFRGPRRVRTGQNGR